MEIIAFLDGPDAAVMESQEVEEYLREAVRDGGRKALQGFFDRRAEREQRLPEVAAWIRWPASGRKGTGPGLWAPASGT